jgi:hypothetical protein
VADAHIRILRRVARQRRLELDAHDAADPTAERKKDADGSTCGNRRHEPHSVSPKPKRDGATPDRIAFPEHNQEP